MAVRNILHMDKLEEFEIFLEAEGYMILPISNNPYEALRAKKGRDTVVIYRRSDAKEHLSVVDKDYKLVRKFIDGSKEPDLEMVPGLDMDKGLPWD